jgi:hypothetical protein
VLYVTKVKGSTSTKDSTAKNGQVNAVTMKDVIDACCNAKRKYIDINLKAATTVGHIKESSHGATYANGKDETDLPRVHHDLLAGTSKSDMGINAMIVTVVTPLAATGVNGQHVNGAESELQNAMDRAAIDVVKGMISFIFFVEQLQMPVEFLISNCFFKLHL